MDREHIVAEIRRTAEANGGKPLGFRRFFSETGIREADWAGKYWARWGDALIEAGFGPNRFQGAYPDDALLERFVALMRELKRYPVAREVKLRATKDKTFPNQKTFSRLGTKAQFAAKIRQYCEGREGYDDVIAMCEAIPSPSDTRGNGKVPEVAFGFVYLLKSGRWYKIGRSNAVGRRERELAIQLPERADTVHTIRTDDPCGIEAYWHQRFQSKRKNGEWFELSAEDVSAFKRRKFM